MSRQSFAELKIPTGAEDVPYPNHRALANGQLLHTADAYVGSVVGAGGVGAILSGIPFEPALVDIHEPTAPLQQRRLPDDVQVNLITGAIAANNVVVEVDDAAVPSWKITLPATIAPDADTVYLVCTGVRDVSGGI